MHGSTAGVHELADGRTEVASLLAVMQTEVSTVQSMDILIHLQQEMAAVQRQEGRILIMCTGTEAARSLNDNLDTTARTQNPSHLQMAGQNLAVVRSHATIRPGLGGIVCRNCTSPFARMRLLMQTWMSCMKNDGLHMQGHL